MDMSKRFHKFRDRCWFSSLVYIYRLSYHEPSSKLLPTSLLCLSPTCRVTVKVWYLANTHSSIPTSIAKPHEVERGRVESTAVVPDRDIVLVLPAEPHLQIVIILQQAFEPGQKHLALLLRHTIDELAVMADREQRLPPRHGVGPDDGVYSMQLTPDILRRATHFRVELKIAALGCGNEVGTAERAGQGLEELLHWG
jgi:hypothetical protein